MNLNQAATALSPLREAQEIVNPQAWLEEPIGRGRHGNSQVAIVNGNRVCIKAYHYFFDRNPAKVELERLQKARAELPEIRDYLQEPIGWLRDGARGPLLVTHLVLDYSGRPSRTLQETRGVSQEFYTKLESVLSVFPERGALYNPVTANILVQRISDTETRPVLIDLTNYKSFRHYPGKACLRLFSARGVESQVGAWVDKTLREVRQKVHAHQDGNLERLSLPDRESYRDVRETEI